MKKLPVGFVQDNNGFAYKKLERAFLSTLSFYGYKNVDVPTLYPIGESFTGGADNRFKLIDREGEILCVIDDAAIGLLNSAGPAPERIATSCEVYKYVGDKRNERQFAMLLTGFGGVEPECEMIKIALDVLNSYGIVGAKAFLSNAMILQGVAEVYLGHRPNATELKKVLERAPKTDSECALDTLIREIMAAKGDVTVLKEVAERTTNATGAQGLRSLLALSDLLEACNIKSEFDLSILGRDYDCGNIFEIRDEDDTVVCRGGRHDYADEGSVVRAVTAVIYPEIILDNYQLKDKTAVNVIIGVADSTKAVSSAYKIKEDLTKNNLSVSLLYKTGKKETFAYADAFNVESAIYVNADGSLENN